MRSLALRFIIALCLIHFLSSFAISSPEEIDKTWHDPITGMEFVYISPGTFLMGSPSNEPGRLDDEKQHRVTLTEGFYMQTAEVTQGQLTEVFSQCRSAFLLTR